MHSYRENMIKKILMVFIIITVIQLIVNTAQAEPSVEIFSTKDSVEKGDIFQIRIKVTTTESIDNIVIDPIPPEGFEIVPNPSIGAEINKDEAEIRINHLEAGSEQIVSFEVTAPTLIGRLANLIPNISKKYKDTSSTEEVQTFVFNIFYNESKNSANSDNLTQYIQASQTKMINIRYTTDMSMYLIFGIIGIIFGHVIKISTKNREDIDVKLEKIEYFKSKLLVILNYIFLTRLPAFLTLLTVGFGVLLVLAEKSPPVNTWDQALALGIGLSVLADEELLSKFKR